MARIIPDPGAGTRAGGRLEPAGTASLARPPSLGARVGRYVWPALCLFQLGLLVSGGLVWYYRTPKPAAADHETAKGDALEGDAPEQAGPKPGEAPSLARGDELAREGRCDLAVKVYQPLLPNASGALRDALQYRMALCLEGMGKGEQAFTAYQTVLSRATNARTTAAAEVGQARVLIRLHRPEEARNLLFALLLRSGQPELAKQPFLADARYLLALTLTLGVMGTEKPGPLTDALAQCTATDWPIETALDWVKPVQDGPPAAPEKHPPSAAPTGGDPAGGPAVLSPEDVGPPRKEPSEPRAAPDAPEKGAVRNFVMVTQLGPAPEQAWVSAAVPPGPLADLVERLATQAKVKVEWTEAAKKAVADSKVEVAFDNQALTDVLLALCDPHNLVWSVKDGVLRLATEAEAPAEALTAFRTATAQRALNNAVATNPGHFLSAAAYLELGNLEARAGRLDEAAAKYERIQRDLPRSPLQVEGGYNLGMVRNRQGQTAAARTAFYFVVDRSPNHELAPLAYLQIGRTYLLEGDADRAVTPLRRALAAGPKSSTHAAAALTLAAAYLLKGEPRLANVILGDSRDAISQEPYWPTAVFLDAYSRYLTPGNRRAPAREASDVLAALWGLPQERVLGPVGALLIGRAYRDLGLTDEMVAVYEKARKSAKGPIAAEMAYAVAEDLFARDQRPAAARLYAALVKTETGRWAGPAEMRLAEIALQENRPDDSLKWCRKTLREKQPVDRGALLTLMGQAYEQTGDHLKAARCFAGEVPEESVADRR
jgi:tetratricopeptide (TPR) repeat protein